jgi:hypothetical protein
MPRQASVNPFCSKVFIGLPWPMNSAGIAVVWPVVPLMA